VVFVTVGTQLAFDRLVRAVDAWAANHLEDQVLAQVNCGTHVPRHIRTVAGLSPAEFERHFAEARLVVAHADMGTIISALEVGKPLVLRPRLASMGEHRNDHLPSTARHFTRFGCIRVAPSEDDVARRIDELLQVAGSTYPQAASGVSPTLIEGSRRSLEAPAASSREKNR
jgi:UDP-N-acetylglucosamine transferase subunit ALG13